MNDDQVKGKVDQLKGGVKQGVGGAIGDKRMEREGTAKIAASAPRRSAGLVVASMASGSAICGA